MKFRKIMSYCLYFNPAKYYAIILCLIYFGFESGCKKASSDNDPNITTTHYSEDQTNFSNPERGFLSQQASYSDSPSPFSKSFFDGLKSSSITLVRKVYIFNTFRSTPISEDFIQHIQDDMDLLRDNGFKIILRFAYTFNEPEPHNDAPLEIVLSHIDQLTPLLQKNADVIALIEAGFIGQWGEWHDSSNGLANTADMRTILFKLLDALPKNRAINVRYQQAKKDIYSTTDPINESEAFNQSNRSRTGHHNDCLVADVDDWGTYWPIDPASLEAQKNYLNQENKFLPQEGETCNCNPPGSECKNSMKELERMRWSALNRDFDQCVLNSWIREGCYDEIAKRLGYRFRLLESKVPKSAQADSLMSFSFIIENDGFAAPYNARDLELVLRAKSSGSLFRFSLSYDPRTWLPDNGKISINPTVTLPSSMLPGNYEVLLNLPDPEPNLNSNPEYSIRFANKVIWEPGTGYNSLLAEIKITK
ncbi:MAG: DUF4832 domain-containing protein [Bacteroidales bacterium]|nr:DUF4832 domain-containing protein [Bacteroidales bacterium]